jgi:hypothetical protein
LRGVENNSSFVNVFGDTPVNRLWEFLIDSRGLFDFSMTDVCEAADISWNTLKGVFGYFVKQKIVKETRKIGRATMYKLNESHPKAIFMINLYKAVNMAFVRGGNMKVEMKVTRDNSTTPLEFGVTQPALKPVCRC